MVAAAIGTWKTATYVHVVIISAVMLCLNVSQMEFEAKPDVVHNFVGVIWATLFFTFGRILIYQNFVPFFLKYNPEETVKAKKSAQQLLNFIFHSLSSAYLCYSLPRRAWWASDWALFNLQPEIQDYRDITLYILQMGYHTNCLAIHFSEPRREDHRVMFVHHSAAVVLIGSSFVANYIHAGLNVLLYHDTSDILACLAKMTNYIGWKKTTLAIFFPMCVVFGLTRIYFFPRFVFTTILNELMTNADMAQIVAFPCMVCLLCLHVYWFSLFVRMGYFAIMGHLQDLTEEKLDHKKEIWERKESPSI